MYVKIMGEDDSPDSDSRSSFSLHENVCFVEFLRENGKGICFLSSPEDVIGKYPVPGNAYIMNAAGKTIERWGSAQTDKEAAAIIARDAENSDCVKGT